MDALDRMLGKKKRGKIKFQPMNDPEHFEPHFFGDGCKFCIHEHECKLQCIHYGDEEKAKGKFRR